jgi:hypothetical protein
LDPGAGQDDGTEGGVKKYLILILAGAALACAECRIEATVEPLSNRDKRIPDERLLAIRHGAVFGCGREVYDYNTQTVETHKAHSLKPGHKVTLRSLDKTPHGKLLVEVAK